MAKKDKKVVADELINITTNAKNKAKEINVPSPDDYVIVLEDDGYYKITLHGETIIHTAVSEKLLQDLKLMQIIPEHGTSEEIQQSLEAYLIRAAKEFVSKELHKKKQDTRGKLDVAGIEDEF